MEIYKTAATDTQIEYLIKKSRFLGIIRRVNSLEQVTECLEKLKKEHPQATHICYGAVADSLGNLMRFSDDGEPQGTAGMPILEVIRKNNLRQVLVAVVRYFGGIKLGAGGLVRAYTYAAAKAIEAAGISTIYPEKMLTIKMSYPVYKRAENALKAEYVRVTDIKWGNDVEVTAYVREPDYNAFLNQMRTSYSDIIIKEG